MLSKLKRTLNFLKYWSTSTPAESQYETQEPLNKFRHVVTFFPLKAKPQEAHCIWRIVCQSVISRNCLATNATLLSLIHRFGSNLFGTQKKHYNYYSYLDRADTTLKWWKILRLLCYDIAMSAPKWNCQSQKASSYEGIGFSSVLLKFMWSPRLSWVWRINLAGQRCQLSYTYLNLRQTLRFLQNKSVLGIVNKIKKEKHPCSSEVFLGFKKSKRFRDFKNVR